MKFNISSFITELIGGDTKHWSRSRIIIVSVIMIVYAVYSQEYQFAMFGIVLVVCRWNNFKVQNGKTNKA
jgi:hypothetical protein